MEASYEEKLNKIVSRARAVGEGNQVIKWARSIISNTKPNRDGLFVSEGIWIHKLMLSAGTKVRALVICPEFIRSEELVCLVENVSSNCPELYTVSQKTFLKLSEREKPDGIISIAELPKREISTFKLNKKSVVLVLDGVEIPGNIGTMIRMSDGAGVDAVFICNRKARMTHPKLIKGSQGAVLTVPFFEFDSAADCFSYLNDNGFTVYLADTRAKGYYYDEPFRPRTAIVMGSERYGISREWYDFDHEMIAIPMLGKCDSLNVGVAATVLCYDACMKIKMQGK